MILKLGDLDLNKLSSIISEFTYNVTCLFCCKYYLIPTTAACGHTLCHSCWRPRHICPSCGLHVSKKDLKLNLTLENRTKHVIRLREAFEDLFNVNLDELTLDTNIEKQTELDPDTHIKEWLTSSQNHFSAPVTDIYSMTQDAGESVEQVTSIQIHSIKKKIVESDREVVHKIIEQDDWDKIEELPEKDVINKNKENLIGPMDIETFDSVVADKEYTTKNPRRSSRNKEIKDNNYSTVNTNYKSSDKENEKCLNFDSEKVSNKSVKNWNSVKRMKTEFSKLNKQNRNKLNASIEMFKKTHIANKTPTMTQQIVCSIDDITPKVCQPKEDNVIVNNDNHKEGCKNNIAQVTSVPDKSLNNVTNDNVNILIPKKDTQNFYGALNKNNKKVENNKDLTPRVCFFKKAPLHTSTIETNATYLKGKNTIIENNDSTVNTDDVEITIKIGTTLTNILIKKKENDVQLKISSDREVQTLNANMNKTKIEINSSSGDTIKRNQNSQDINEVCKDITTKYKPQVDKSESTKKNTASADTSTVHFEISESVEKELIDNVENEKFVNNQDNVSLEKMSKSKDVLKTQIQPSTHKLDVIPEDMELFNEIDIFDGESVKEGNIQLLKSSEKTPSAILMPTSKSKSKSQKFPGKRDREENPPNLENISNHKRLKISHEDITNNVEDCEPMKEKDVIPDSENISYDAIMSQVFANIDADMKNLQETQNIGSTTHNNNTQTNGTQNNNSTKESLLHETAIPKEKDDVNEKNNRDTTSEKFSENVFTLLEKDVNSEIFSASHKMDIQNDIQKISDFDKSKTENIKESSQIYDIDIVELSTPNHDDDDKSVVEDTPQKSTSFSKNKNKLELAINHKDIIKNTLKRDSKDKNHRKMNISMKDINMINISDSLGETSVTGKIVAVIDPVRPSSTSETPLNIAKFVNQIKHKSTPMARKSLNFNQSIDDCEETLCPSSIVAAKTTQEKEFMSKAFEQSMNSPSQVVYAKPRYKNKKLYIAGSCLTPSNITDLKVLCSQRNWTFIDKFTKDLTHLIVGVDEERKSQRSVKYMCTLAASKWILSYEWVEKCIQTKDIVDEEPFEALDHTGEPGPRRSRLSKRKLFEGITFYCMPPFGILDVETLKDMLQMSGGRVVNDPTGVRVTETPALLLAEPEKTQADRFIYLAMELSVVPVNFEWVLNCLGSYTLSSIYELLLCPASLLPPVTSKWPPELVSRDYE